MASAKASRLDSWVQWLQEVQEGRELPRAILIFTDKVRVEKCNGEQVSEWLTELCQEHESGTLLEARLFGNKAEALMRWETEGDWLCRLVSDDDAGDNDANLGTGLGREVFLWGERLEGTNTWFELRMKPLDMPLDGEEPLAVAEITIYERDGGSPVWRFKNLTTQGAG